MATKNETKPVKKTPVIPTYTVEEFASAPESLGVDSPDIIVAAFAFAGKDKATIEEAKKLVTTFKNKEV